MKKLPFVIAIVAVAVFVATMPLRVSWIKAKIEAYKAQQAATPA
jgi:hypothetical protein